MFQVNNNETRVKGTIDPTSIYLFRANNEIPEQYVKSV